MGGRRGTGRWLGAVLLALAGCYTPDPDLKPKIPEEYVLPPRDDTRFSSPPQFPKETLDQDILKKNQLKDPADAFKQAGGFGPSGPRGAGGFN